MHNIQLVTPAPAVPYTFKVGDKGLTRDGRTYHVLAAYDDKNGQRKLAVLVDGMLCTREVSGYVAWNQYIPSPGDLLPPTKLVWRVELTGVKNPGKSGLLEMVSVRYYATEDDARAGIMRGVQNYITVKGPFAEERQA